MTSTDQRSLPLSVLIVEDKEDEYVTISNYITNIAGGDFQTNWCDNYETALDGIQRSSHLLYFIDYNFANKRGLDLLTEAMVEPCDAPIIMLTGEADQSIDRKSMQLGASDFLVKSELSTEKLERCIRYSMERAANLKRLKESERQYRNIFERTGDVVFIADEQLRFSRVNKAASQMFGHPQPRLIGLSLLDLFFLDNDKESVRSKLLREGRIDDYQVILKTTQHNKVGLLSVSLETDLKGGRYTQGIIHEITLLKRTEEIRIQMEKIEAKARVIRTLAHEVRNPLNNIQLSVENLKSSDATETAEFLAIIARNSQRINNLINDLMDSTRFQKMQLEAGSLQSVMDDALYAVQDRLALSNIELERVYSGDLAMSLIDREKLRIALTNLIINAIEAVENGKGRITISVTYGQHFHEIAIADNGCGMTEDTIKDLFVPYFTTKPKGVGLGLVASEAIIVAHKATIGVSSEPGRGTVFKLVFPTFQLLADEITINANAEFVATKQKALLLKD